MRMTLFLALILASSSAYAQSWVHYNSDMPSRLVMPEPLYARPKKDADLLEHSKLMPPPGRRSWLAEHLKPKFDFMNFDDGTTASINPGNQRQLFSFKTQDVP